MRYFTKEIRRLEQIFSIPFELKTDERTKEFSEDLFKELFEDFKKDVCEYIPPDSEYYDLLPKQTYESNIVYVEKYFPKEILSKVSDIRFLAIQRCTKAIYDEITAFFAKYRALCDKATQDYFEEYKRDFSDAPPPFTQYSLHDCKITSLEWKGKDLVMHLDNSGGLTDRNVVVFEKAEILEKEDGIEGAWWLYDELHKTENGYEFHGLIERYENSEWYDLYFTVACKDIKMHKRN